MSPGRLGRLVVIDRMEMADIPAVKAIEGKSFPTEWPAGVYRQEIERETAHYFVARAAPGGAGISGAPRRGIVGYAGIWMQADEAHISTLAVHPRFRGHGIGAQLVLRLVELAVEEQAAFVTLEVRASNRAARALYARFGFLETGRRKAYYSDSGEDAIIMTTPSLTDPEFRDRIRRLSGELGM